MDDGENGPDHKGEGWSHNGGGSGRLVEKRVKNEAGKKWLRGQNKHQLVGDSECQTRWLLWPTRVSTLDRDFAASNAFKSYTRLSFRPLAATS